MKKLSQAFDFQRFQHNERLAGIISDVESRYAHALSDDDLELVSAAGDAQPGLVEALMPQLIPPTADLNDCYENSKN